MIERLLAIAAAFGVSCGTGVTLLPPNAPLKVLPSAGLHAATTEVASAINGAVGEVLVVVVPDAADGTVRIIEGGATAGTCGTYDLAKREIHVESCGSEYLRCTLTHEIGHALGLEHAAAETSVMYESVHAMSAAEAAASLAHELEAQRP